jgi:hypothetical protein
MLLFARRSRIARPLLAPLRYFDPGFEVPGRAMSPFPDSVPKVSEVREFRARGSWRSKSGGILEVLFALSRAEALQFLDANSTELDRDQIDIRGLRMFVVSDIPRHGIGGLQFHRVRTEIGVTTKGTIRWTLEDLYGTEREILVPLGAALFIPPYILHTTRAEEAGSEITTIANTLYDPEDRRTHDTYPIGEFRELQRAGANA